MNIPGLREDESVNLKGKSHPTFPGILRLAHEAGLLGLEVSVLQFPDETNGQMAVCQAIATFPGPDGRDRIFTEIGDCDLKNCGPMIAPHRIRMAATRSKGRALRDALGIGVAMAEEIGGVEPKEWREDASGASYSASSSHVRQSPRVRHEQAVARPPAPQSPFVEEEERFCSECGILLTNDEVRGCRSRSWPLLCATHGAAYKQQQHMPQAEQPKEAA
jgi:hypothetical protein